MNKVLAINFITAVISSGLAVTVPLLLIAREINPATIGLVLAVAPLVFGATRIIFAAVADATGAKKIFILSPLSAAVSCVTFIIASNPLTYGLGKVFSGIQDAAIWAVNRSAVAAGSKQIEISTAKMKSLYWLGTAVGMTLVGLTLTKFSFEQTLGALTVLALVATVIGFFLKPDAVKASASKILGKIHFIPKTPKALKTAFIMSLGEVSAAPLVLALTLYLSQIGYSAFEIGAVLALYFAVAFVVMQVMLSRKNALKSADIILPAAGVSCTALLAIPLLPNYTPLLVAIMAVGDGLGSIVWEKLVVNALSDKKNMSTEIGVLHFPSKIIGALALAFAGLLIEKLGFAAGFAFLALAWIAFAVESRKILKMNYDQHL